MDRKMTRWGKLYQKPTVNEILSNSLGGKVKSLSLCVCVCAVEKYSVYKSQTSLQKVRSSQSFLLKS